MNREEILEKARRENKNQDMQEKDAINRASVMAARVGAIVCCLMAVLEEIFTEHVSLSSWVIYCAIMGSTALVKYRILHKKSELALMMAFFVLGAAFLTLHVISLVGELQ